MIKRIVSQFLKSAGYRLQKIEKKNQRTLSRSDEASSAEDEPFSQLPFAGKALKKLIEDFDFETVLDVGSGEGKHSECLKMHNKKVTAIDFGTSVYYQKKSEVFTSIIGD